MLWHCSAPPFGQEFRKAVHRMGGDAREHVAQAGEGIDVVALAGGDEAEEDDRGRAGEEPVLRRPPGGREGADVTVVFHPSGKKVERRGVKANITVEIREQEP